MIDTFTRQIFEQKIAKFNPEPVGVIMGEYCYLLPLENDVKILLRSSIAPNGVSRENGEDSIRTYIVQIVENPRRMQMITKDVHKYTTRRPGWESRIEENIKNLMVWYHKCPICGQPLPVYKVKNGKKENIGRIFVVCKIPEHKNYSWKWLT